MRWLSIALVLGLGACGLEVPKDEAVPPSPGGDGGAGKDTTGRDYFVEHVAPLVNDACTACHVGPETSPMNNFLGATAGDVDGYYDHITNDRSLTGNFNPSASRLLTKGIHTGPAWTGAQAQDIAEWLQLEAALRAPPPTNGDGLDLTTQIRDLEESFAACMSVSQNEFDTSMAPVIANVVAEGSTCATCHSDDGAGGAFFATDSSVMLGKWRQQVYFEAILEVNVAGDGTTLQVGLARNLCNKGLEKQAGTGSHPAYDCMSPVGGVTPITAVDQFRAALQAKYDANACPSTGFAPPD